MDPVPTGFLDKLLISSLKILAAALILDVAIHLIESVWIMLVMGLVAIAFIGLGIMVARTRHKGW